MCVEYAKFLMNYLGAWNSCSAALVGVMCMSGAPLLVRKQTKNRTKIERSERESEGQKQSVCVCVWRAWGSLPVMQAARTKYNVFSRRSSRHENTNLLWIIKTCWKLYIHKIKEHKILRAQKMRELKMLKPQKQIKP
jgi:hypothetical protein